MESYNAKSCSALEKPFYRPIEAALRWCNLTAHEVDILQITGASLLPPAHAFPHWPCLRANAEKIIDAIQNSELQKGREGRTVAPGETVAELAIRGHAVHQLKDGGFLVCKYGHTFHATDFAELQAFARRLGVSQ